MLNIEFSGSMYIHIQCPCAPTTTIISRSVLKSFPTGTVCPLNTDSPFPHAPKQLLFHIPSMNLTAQEPHINETM